MQVLAPDASNSNNADIQARFWNKKSISSSDLFSEPQDHLGENISANAENTMFSASRDLFATEMAPNKTFSACL